MLGKEKKKRERRIKGKEIGKESDMFDRIAAIELILKKCLEDAEMIESSSPVTSEVLKVGEEMALQAGALLGMAAQDTDLLEEEVKNKSIKAELLPRLRDFLRDLQSASDCLAVHLRIARTLLEWTGDEETIKPVDDWLALLSGALGEVKALEPPESISELRRTHENIKKNLESYMQLYAKIKEGKEKGHVEILEEASSDLAKLETTQLLEPIEMFSMKEGLEKALEMLVDLKQEIGRQ